MDIEDNAAARSWLDIATHDARAASSILARADATTRDRALQAAAAAIRRASAQIVAANALDLSAYDAAQGTAAFRDRLALDPARVEAMARGLDDIAALPDPLARTLADWTRPNGLRIRRIASPIGVIGMIYESRPNVGADAAGLCLKSGNAVILRGGSDSFRSARRHPRAPCRRASLAAGLPAALVQIAPDSRPRLRRRDARGRRPDRPHHPPGRQDPGGARARRGPRARPRPREGLCHTYIHAAADPSMARAHSSTPRCGAPASAAPPRPC